MPVIGEIREEGMRIRSVGDIRQKVGAEDVRAVEVRRRIRGAQVIGVIAGEEESDIALLIIGVAEGVAGAYLVVVREAFLEMCLKRIVGRCAHSFKECGIGAVPNVGSAEVDVAAIVGAPGLIGDGSKILAVRTSADIL